ncbi:alpha/beta hydrolase [Actinoplanes sp. NPDC051470]|uniref:alpha/beta fold hydrolase n=1 Tax=Actinoplanes sp. NPDC051470 TaxID=3157224 RepID=UPI00343DDD0D
MAAAWPTVGTVQVNGVRLGYRECGDPGGVPAVLLHGTGSRHDTWDRLASRLTGYRVVAVNLRGHGDSERCRNYSLNALRVDLLGVLEALSLRDTVMVGHSIGGYVALATALHSPDRVARLVLEDPAVPPRGAVPLGAAAPLPAGPDRVGPDRVGRRLVLPSLHGGSRLGMLAAAAGILAARRDFDLFAMWSIVRQVTRPDPGWWSCLDEVRQPTLVLSGGPTSCIPPRRLAEMTSRLPDARLATIPVGHRVHSLAPDEFFTEVAAFLTASARSLAA